MKCFGEVWPSEAAPRVYGGLGAEIDGHTALGKNPLKSIGTGRDIENMRCKLGQKQRHDGRVWIVRTSRFYVTVCDTEKMMDSVSAHDRFRPY